MRSGRVPAAAVDVDRRAVAVGILVQLALFGLAVRDLTFGRSLYLVGIGTGLVVGASIGRYDDAMTSGLVAGGVGGAIGCLGLAVYGSVLSWRLGFGLDSLYAAQFGFRGLILLVLVVPIHAVEAAVAAVVANEVRLRLAAWFA